MKNSFPSIVILVVLIIATHSCSNTGSKKPTSDTTETNVSTAGLIPVGSNIITEVILNPDTLGDPWEVEKVKGLEATVMFTNLLEKINNNTISVYTPHSEEQMKPDDVKKVLDEFGSDVKKIGKIQFCDDWFLNPSSGDVVRKTRSIILGYEIRRDPELPVSYKAMFMIKP